MAETRTCSVCGIALPPYAPEGLCPKCLLERGLGAHSEAETVAPTTGLEKAEAPPVGVRVRYFGDYELLEEIARGEGVGRLGMKPQYRAVT